MLAPKMKPILANEQKNHLQVQGGMYQDGNF